MKWWLGLQHRMRMLKELQIEVIMKVLAGNYILWHFPSEYRRAMPVCHGF